MKVFISWSKPKSMKYAIKTKELLENINSQIEAFVSEVDINGGEDVQERIIRKIIECDKLVLCFTKENKKAPWLLFEAGYARGLKKTVIPLLFDYDPNWHSWVDNPMNIAREVCFNNTDFITSFINSFSINNTAITRKKINTYIQSINEINESFRVVDMECEDLVEKLTHNDAFVMENPFFRDKSAYFLSGFESYDLLKIVTTSFLYTGKYLWIYGRKNMKLFGGSFQGFFSYLKEKVASEHLEMDGIDFRCLFLDPTSKEVEKAHLQQNIFRPELEATIQRAKDVIGDNSQLKKCFRFYSNRRQEIIIRLDNSIICSRPSFDASGYPQLLTNTAFEVYGATSAKGKECIKKFENVWNNSKEMN
jgi:nucleoside 2-deoxyribosyltransferase